MIILIIMTTTISIMIIIIIMMVVSFVPICIQEKGAVQQAAASAQAQTTNTRKPKQNNKGEEIQWNNIKKMHKLANLRWMRQLGMLWVEKCGSSQLLPPYFGFRSLGQKYLVNSFFYPSPHKNV